MELEHTSPLLILVVCNMERKAMRIQSNILVYLWHAQCSRCKIPEAIRKDSIVVRSLDCGVRAHFSSPADTCVVHLDSISMALSPVYKMGILGTQ